MIHHSITTTNNKEVVGIQKSNNNYTYLHWKDHSTSTSKFKWLRHFVKLEEEKYKPIGPTLLVEWGDE